MDEAYAQLYQEFVRLRSLCLKQASLLEQLTAALKQQQQGGANEEMAITSSQLDSEVLVFLNRTPPPLLSAAAASGPGGPREPQGTPRDLLALELTKLSVEVQRREPEFSVPLSLSSVMTLLPGASHQNQISNFTNTNGIPVTSCSGSSPGNSMSTRESDTLGSDVALQSQVCEFCQAEFPSNTTTREQYLQHLYTHIT